LDWSGGAPAELGKLLEAVSTDELAILMVTNRGVKVWPEGLPETFCTDHWRCRFMPRKNGATVEHRAIVALLQRMVDAGLDFIKTEHLCTFDGQPGFSLGQGQ